MSLIEQLRVASSVFTSGTLTDKIIAVLILVILCSLLWLEHLWLKRINRIRYLQPESTDTSPQIVPATSANRIPNIRNTKSGFVGKLAWKALNIPSCTSPSTHQTSTPDAIDTNQAVADGFISQKGNTDEMASQSGVISGGERQSEKGRTG